MSTPFNSEKIITHKINDAELSTFLVGFDIDDNGDSKYLWISRWRRNTKQ